MMDACTKKKRVKLGADEPNKVGFRETDVIARRKEVLLF